MSGTARVRFSLQKTVDPGDENSRLFRPERWNPIHWAIKEFKLEPCCEDLAEAVNNGPIECRLTDEQDFRFGPSREVYLGRDEYETQILHMGFCPFCGARIDYVKGPTTVKERIVRYQDRERVIPESVHKWREKVEDRWEERIADA